MKSINYISGGMGSTIFSQVELMPYADKDSDVKNEYSYRYAGHGSKSFLESIENDNMDIICRVPLVCIVKRLSKSSILSLAKQHGILINTKRLKSDIISAFFNSSMYSCNECITIFRQVNNLETYKHNYYKHNILKTKIKPVGSNNLKLGENRFPPLPSTTKIS